MRASPEVIFFALSCLVACQGAVTDGEIGAVKAPAPQGNYATQDGVLGSQSASQDVTKNYGYNLRFPGEAMNGAADIGHLFYYAKQDQDKFPAALVEKVISFPQFQHEACCAGRWVRVVDLGALPPAEGESEADRAYHTFTQLVLGHYDWQVLSQARYRDYGIGSADAMGQNVPWVDLGLKKGNFYSFFLLPEGQAPQESWQTFDSESALLGLYSDKAVTKLRDLRVMQFNVSIPVQVKTSGYTTEEGLAEPES